MKKKELTNCETESRRSAEKMVAIFDDEKGPLFFFLRSFFLCLDDKKCPMLGWP